MKTICGIIGFPVKHSLSPAMHNAGYEALGLEFEYRTWEFEDVAAAIEQMRNEGIRGYSVTIPHKVTVMEYLDEVDEVAAKIGAVNTVVNEEGRLKGYNTDWIGCVKALEEVTAVDGKNVVVVGAGGAARAVAFGVKEADCGRLTILNRTFAKAESLAAAVGGGCGALDDEEAFKEADILINTTSVGMEPDDGSSPVPASLLNSEMTVHDIVYKPLQTQLIKDATEKDCQIITGEKMLLYQGVAQFELFTGLDAPIEIIKQALATALAG